MSPPLRCSPAVALLVLFCAVVSSQLVHGLTAASNERASSVDSTGYQAKEIHPRTNNETRPENVIRLSDCSDLPANYESGVYPIYPGQGDFLVLAFCDNEDAGGWTVIQRRADITPRVDFYETWEVYKWILGSLYAEFYWGNEHIHMMTSLSGRTYELYIHLEDFDGFTAYALYQDFQVASEDDNYRLTVGAYSGDAGDSLTYHSGSQFSTKDRDNDDSSANCAETYKGAWWYNNCYSANLNGLYLSAGSVNVTGITWRGWQDLDSLKTVVMKIRPT